MPTFIKTKHVTIAYEKAHYLTSLTQLSPQARHKRGHN